MSGTNLQKIATVFRQWRSGKSHKSRIPEELWESAIDAAKSAPISQVAKAAGLDYYQLRSRVERRKTDDSALAPIAVTKVIASGGIVSPLMEVEVAGGTKIRFFSESDAMRAVLQHLMGG